jgi:hypothetical protein
MQIAKRLPTPTKFLLGFGLLIFCFSCGEQNAPEPNQEVLPAPAQDNAAPSTSAPSAGLLKTDPSPVRICDGSKLGQAKVSWTVDSEAGAQVRVGSPDGTLFASSKGSGTSETGKWLREGLQLYLISDGKVIDRLTIHVTTQGCP